MVLNELWRLLEDRVFPVPSTEILFNPYSTVDPDLDRPGADTIRRSNLLAYLGSFDRVPPVLIVGEAPGPRGCRFSGVPFTNEAQLLSGTHPFSGRQSSNRPAPYGAYSSNALWDALGRYYPRFLLWNSVPFHPHRPGEALSIRTPRGTEVREWSGLLGEMVGLLQPELIVALGRKAQEAMRQVGVGCIYLRHPSMGGLRAFRDGVVKLLGPRT